MKETKFAEKVEAAGGHAYIVGGWVRDKILGRESHDKDYAVSGLTQEKFRFSKVSWVITSIYYDIPAQRGHGSVSETHNPVFKLKTSLYLFEVEVVIKHFFGFHIGSKVNISWQLNHR